jgi:hypothetical protein
MAGASALSLSVPPRVEAAMMPVRVITDTTGSFVMNGMKRFIAGDVECA